MGAVGHRGPRLRQEPDVPPPGVGVTHLAVAPDEDAVACDEVGAQEPDLVEELHGGHAVPPHDLLELHHGLGDVGLEAHPHLVGRLP